MGTDIFCLPDIFEIIVLIVLTYITAKVLQGGHCRGCSNFPRCLQNIIFPVLSTFTSQNPLSQQHIMGSLLWFNSQDMIQGYTTFPEDTGKHPQPQTPPTAALSVVPSLYLARQGKAGWPGQVREGMGYRIKTNRERRRKKSW